MRQLRYSEQRNKIHFRRLPVPVAAEKPLAFVPYAAIPKELLDIGDRPQSRQKYQPVMRKRAVNAAGSLAAKPRVNIDQCKVRHAMNDDICHRESLIIIENDDADVPANDGCRDNDVLADV